MTTGTIPDSPRSPGTAERDAPIELSAAEFRAIGHALVDEVAGFLDSLPLRPVAPGEKPDVVRALLPSGGLPEQGMPADRLMTETARLLFEHSTFNGHPRFFGYITAPAAPLGVLGEMLAAAVNPNCGGWSLSPAATEIERQAIRWISELVGFPTTGAGLFVSGGNVANIVCFIAARAAKARHDVRTEGVAPGTGHGPLVCYGSVECHTWIQKAVDVTGLGTSALRWIPTDARKRMRMDALREQVARDREAGMTPFLVVGSAGTTSTGSIDPLRDLGAFCREEDLWYHVDGAYGAPAAIVPDAPDDLRAVGEADSVAVDPHKWLYAPLEAGCAIVRDASALRDAFHYRPPYYHFEGTDEEPPVNFYEYGLQNSRGFRALKVWLTLRQVGRDGYRRMISDDIALTRLLFDTVAGHPELRAVTCELSVATFAYVPPDLSAGYDAGDPAVARYVDELNAALLLRTQEEGRLYLSNAVVNDRFLLRSCIVNFRTTEADARAVAGLVVDAGRRTDALMRTAAS